METRIKTLNGLYSGHCNINGTEVVLSISTCLLLTNVCQVKDFLTLVAVNIIKIEGSDEQQHLKKFLFWESSLTVQWLGLGAFAAMTAVKPGSNWGREAKIPRTVGYSQGEKKLKRFFSITVSFELYN